MKMQLLGRRGFAFVAAIAFLSFSGWASADPPSRVARLGYTSGAVSFSPAGEIDWVQAAINRPLTTGDRLWADPDARAEIQIGGAMVRLDGGTGVSVLNLDDRIAQLQLTQGTLNVRVRRLAPGQVLEVDTPNLAFTLRQPGAYRIEVEPDGNATTIVVRQGTGEAYGEGASYVVDSRQAYRFYGTGLREYQYVDAPRPDEFDRWAGDRDRSFDTSASARYVSPEVIGYQDLDASGYWRVDPTYGNVWIPNRVEAGWAPYRDGHWAWVDPWGWTWIDDAPWGFAVSHYGRWANFGGTWGWVPGPVRTPAYYAPALVVFVGGATFQITVSSGPVGGIAWFPLAPREVYRPAYAVSRGYFENVNRSNTVINTTVINNYYYNKNVTNIVHVNRRVPGAVVAVPTTAFVQSQPVSRAAVRVSRDMIVAAPVAPAAPAVPTERSVRGAATPRDKPPARVFERPVVARSAPPAAAAGFAAQQAQLAATPGQPLDDAARKALKPADAPAPAVKVVAPAQVAPPTARPPRAASAAGAKEEPATSDERKSRPVPAKPHAPAPPPQASAHSQAPPSVPAASAQPGNAGPGGRQERPPQAVTPAPASSQAAVPPTTPARPSEPHGKPAQRGSGEAPGQAVAPTQTTSQRAAEPKAAPPQPAPPAQRGKPASAAATRPAEPAAAVVVPGAPPPPPSATSQAQSQGQASKPATGKPTDKKQGGENPLRE